MRLLNAASQLRIVLRELETVLGLEKFSHLEIDVLYAALQLSARGKTFSSPEVIEHQLVKGYGRTTIYRALAKLENEGFIIVYTNGPTKQFTFRVEVH